jgi:hypothetical protein
VHRPPAAPVSLVSPLSSVTAFTALHFTGFTLHRAPAQQHRVPSRHHP